ncbi:MAG: alkene reductase [Alcaligenaceae bacterium]|nr:alkene reductase [Alcaligenaceae bacterium]
MMKSLFSAYNLSGLTLKNRLVMAPMTRSRAQDTVPSEITALYYKQRAGAGLIISEGSQISTQAVGYLFTPGIHSKEQVQGWKKVTEAVHEEGGKIFCQLWHVGRISHTSLHQDGASPVSSSNIRAKKTTSFTYDDEGKPAHLAASRPRALTTDEVKATAEDFARAALNAIEAGFDGVEIHGANGYLIEQFINGGINDRSDEYTGKTVEGRIRFALEVVDAVVAAIGNERVGIRLSPFNRIFDMPDFEGEEDTWLTLARELSKKNLAYVHISNRKAIISGEAGLSFLKRFRDAYDGTLILAGEYTQAEADHDLQEGLSDLVAFGRPFISNPDLAERMKNNWPITPPNPATFYGGGEYGYTDYPAYELGVSAE